jgi:CshA-type fibril repeat protein
VHNPTSATLTVTVTAVTPVALSNWATTAYGTPVDIPVLGNDRAGAATAPLVPAGIRLRLAPDLPTGSTLSGDAKTLTVAGRGTFAARTDGSVVFTPAPAFTGRVPTIGYQVSDANGTSARASITVQVSGAAVMRPTQATVRAGETVVVDVLSNDDPPFGAGWDRSSVCLRFFAGECTKGYDLGFVSWSVDPVDGTITFYAERQLDPGVFPYSVRDTTGVTHTSELDVIIQPAREARGD